MIFITLKILIVSIFAGILGSILGLGGGIIITPALTLFMGIDIKFAIGASLISVIATSSGSAIAYIRDKITNIRIGMFLEIATTIGAISGAYLNGLLNPNSLYIVFGSFLLYSAVMMIKKSRHELPQNVPLDPIAKKLKLSSSYHDKILKKDIEYNVDKVYNSFGLMYVAGVLSGLLGIGSGTFKVMAMDVYMKLPLKVSSATSNFMMGVTAAASAGVFFQRGNIDPRIAAPVAVGVLIGASIGTRIMQRLSNKTIRFIFIPVLIYISMVMIFKGFKIQ